LRVAPPREPVAPAPMAVYGFVLLMAAGHRLSRAASSSRKAGG
jgi:hypothetical protein